MKFEEKFGSATKDAIARLEEKFSLKLPEDYKNFLVETNGGVVDGEKTKGIVLSEEYGENLEVNVDVFFGVDTEENATNIDYWMEQDYLEDDILENTVLIGDTYQHGFIVLICEGEDKGVYYWDDTYTFEQSSDEGNMYWIADTFTEMLEMM